jgi:hypothetical protein
VCEPFCLGCEERNTEFSEGWQQDKVSFSEGDIASGNLEFDITINIWLRQPRGDSISVFAVFWKKGHLVFLD